jgi:hypothetical protein
MARICGFSLGQEETTRLANISLIQAKEEALLALQKAKQKIVSSSVTSIESDNRVLSEKESSEVEMSPVLELERTSANVEDNLSHSDQG